MKNCYGYIRVSTAKQGEGVSLEAQKDAIQAYSERNNLTITKWFEEKETAAKQGRPLFNAMVRQLRQGKAQGLVIHKIDRSARNFADWAKIGDLSDSGISIYFATETLDFHSRGGRLTADIQAVIAADYIRNLRDECIKGLNGRLKQGLYPFRAPIGYLDNGRGNPKTPDPARAKLIHKLFELYASGRHSLISLQAEMDRRGLRNYSGNPLSINGIVTVLDNPFYCGLIRIKRTGKTYPGIHKKIISPALFERVQDVRTGRSVKRFTKHNHIYRGLFRCALCNSSMIPELQKGHVYYRCQETDCPTKTVREEVIDLALQRLFNKFRHSLKQQAKLKAGLQKWIESDYQSEERISQITLQMAKVSQRMERLTDALIDRLIDQDGFETRKQKLLLEKSSLEEEIAETGKKSFNLRNVEKFLELVNNLGLTFQNLKRQEKREFAKMLSSNRQVDRKNVVLQPQNWLHSLEFILYIPFGDPCRRTNRTCAFDVNSVFGFFLDPFE